MRDLGLSDFWLVIVFLPFAMSIVALGYSTLSWFYAWKTRRLIEREAAERRAWSKFKED